MESMMEESIFILFSALEHRIRPRAIFSGTLDFQPIKWLYTGNLNDVQFIKWNAHAPYVFVENTTPNNSVCPFFLAAFRHLCPGPAPDGKPQEYLLAYHGPHGYL